MTSDIAQQNAWFWLTAGILVGVAASLAIGALWSHARERFGRRVVLSAIVSIGAFAMVAVLVYSRLGRPDLLAENATTVAHVGARADRRDGDSQSMEAVTQRLADRLARDGGSDGDWELLAQSYEYIGRVEDADLARKRVVAPANNSRSTPPESAAMLTQANAARVQRKYADAKAAYEKLIAANGMTADSWADYADVLASMKPNASSAAKLAGEPAVAIDKALALDPDHSKALWLKASLAHEERRYRDALEIWRRLRQVIGDNETDVRIIDANIAEAQALAGTTRSNNVVAGTIEIDPKLAARAAPGSTLFVYAKAADMKGPPLAVYRTTVSTWPVRFALDDSMAMMPNRTLSSAGTVIVEARISRNGEATSAPGDLQATGARVDVKAGKNVRLRIDKEVG